MPQHSSKESGEDFEKCEDATVFAFVDSAREEFVIAEWIACLRMDKMMFGQILIAELNNRTFKNY